MRKTWSSEIKINITYSWAQADEAEIEILPLKGANLVKK